MFSSDTIRRMALLTQECQQPEDPSPTGGIPVNLKPLGDRVIVEVIEEDQTTASGIVLPDTAKEKPQRGRVLATGDGRWEDGKQVPVAVHEGDEVLYSKYGGTEVRLDGTDYLILRENDILAVWTGVPAAV
jgi:chaperonin GroES